MSLVNQSQSRQADKLAQRIQDRNTAEFSFRRRLRQSGNIIGQQDVEADPKISFIGETLTEGLVVEPESLVSPSIAVEVHCLYETPAGEGSSQPLSSQSLEAIPSNKDQSSLHPKSQRFMSDKGEIEEEERERGKGR